WDGLNSRRPSCLFQHRESPTDSRRFKILDPPRPASPPFPCLAARPGSRIDPVYGAHLGAGSSRRRAMAQQTGGGAREAHGGGVAAVDESGANARQAAAPAPATLILEGKEHTLPAMIGSEGEKAIDISQLRAQTGYVTFDPGYGNTGACESDITFI